MGCFQTHEIDLVDDACVLQDKSNSVGALNELAEMDKSPNYSADFNDEKAKLRAKPSEVLVLTPEVTAELLKTFQRVLIFRISNLAGEQGFDEGHKVAHRPQAEVLLAVAGRLPVRQRKPDATVRVGL